MRRLMGYQPQWAGCLSAMSCDLYSVRVGEGNPVMEGWVVCARLGTIQGFDLDFTQNRRSRMAFPAQSAAMLRPSSTTCPCYFLTYAYSAIKLSVLLSTFCVHLNLHNLSTNLSTLIDYYDLFLAPIAFLVLMCRDVGVDPNKSTWVDLGTSGKAKSVSIGAVDSLSNVKLKSDFTPSAFFAYL